MIPANFIVYAADILGETSTGLSGSKIAKHLSVYSIEFNVDVPFPIYPFPKGVPNKRTALRKNLLPFSPEQQFQIINDLCEFDELKTNKDVKTLRIRLISRYGHLNTGIQSEEINEALLEETKHWLIEYPESLELYEDALTKFENKIYQRNLLDDLRLALEKLFQSILDNNKSLENQLSSIGNFIKLRNGSKELNNMFVKLIDYYSKYQNTYVKHNDAVIENEIEIIFEITSSFMKFIIRIK